jgi:OTU domain-containing protein 5
MEPAEIQARNTALDNQLQSKQLYPVDVEGDGNCFFRALSSSLYGHQYQHAELRASVANFLSLQADAAPVVDRVALHKHATVVAKTGTWVGEDVILAAACNLLRPIHVYIAACNSSPLIYAPSMVSTDSLPLLLAFYEPGHYRSVVQRRVMPPDNDNASGHLNRQRR